MADRKTSAIFGAGTGPGGSITRFGREGDDTTYVGVDAVLSADVGDAPMRQRQYRAGRGDFCVEACGPRNPTRDKSPSTACGPGSSARDCICPKRG